MAIRRVGLIIYKVFPKGANPELSNAYVDRVFEDGAKKLEALLADGFSVVANSVVTVEDVTFMVLILHKPEGGLQP